MDFRVEISRFFRRYQTCISVSIGILLFIQIILAARVMLIPEKDNSFKKNDDEIVKTIVTVNVKKVHYYAAPECNITSIDSISAINRARSQECKDKIIDLSCQVVNDKLYVKRMPKFCKNEANTYGKYLGCFEDYVDFRQLSNHSILRIRDNSPQSCIDSCLKYGFQYAGVQQGDACFCGDEKPQSYLERRRERCNMTCTDEIGSSKIILDDNKSEVEWDGSCGGILAMDVFETGAFSDKDNKTKTVGLDGRKADGSLADKPEKVAQIVFFLTLNGRSVRQVLRLIKALFKKNHFFYIHVDSRQDYLYRNLLPLSHLLPNHIRFMEKRKATIWGAASLLTILLSGMEELLNNTETWNWNWDYVINLSESDFPIKSTDKLETFLSYNRGLNFLGDHERNDTQEFIDLQGVERTFIECEHRMWLIDNRKFPGGIMIDGGNDWLCLYRDFIKYILTSKDGLVSGLKTIYAYTLLPAESFFHMVIRNSEYCRTYVNNDLHEINWNKSFGCKCPHESVDWCGCSPVDFRPTDWKRLTEEKSKIRFFARKFEPIVSQSIINRIESWIYPQREEVYLPTIDRFWLSLHHTKDLSPMPDDALVTLGRSLARIAGNSFALKNNFVLVPSKHDVGFGLEEVIQLEEITSYSQDDTLQGLLVRFNMVHFSFNGSPETSRVSLEAWFRIEDHVKFAPKTEHTEKYLSKIQDLEIGTDYEKKERIFRNHARSIGPFSEPVLKFTIMSDEPVNIVANFIDPSGIIQAVVSGTGGNLTGHNVTSSIKPVLKVPLQPGVWIVEVLTMNGHLLADVKMLVLPLEIYRGGRLSSKDSLQINGKLSDYVTNEVSYMNRLRRLIDDFVKKFYTAQGFCLETQVAVNNPSQLLKTQTKKGSNNKTETSLCNDTQWSSLFPDPKSTITGIDSETGLLLP